MTFAEFLAADDRDPIVLAELHPSIVASGFTPQTTTGLLTGTLTTGALKNNVTGCVGFKFTALAAITVTALGRVRLTGNSLTHTLRLMEESAAGVLSTLATVTVDLSSGTINAIKYSTLATPVQLAAGHVYHLYSSETNGGDQWLDDSTTITVASVAQAVTSVTQATCGAASYTPGTAGANRTSGIVDALFAHTYSLAFPRFAATADIPGGIYRRVDGVRQDDVELVEGASSTLTAGQWWFDELNDTLWVRTTAGSAPDSFTSVQVFVTLFAATTGIVLDLVDGDPSSGVYFRPWLIGGVSGVTDQAADPILGGNVTIGGEVAVMNEGQALNKLFAPDGDWRWHHKTVTLRYGGRIGSTKLPHANYAVVGTVLMVGVAADE